MVVLGIFSGGVGGGGVFVGEASPRLFARQTTEQSRLKSTQGGKGPKASKVVAGSFQRVSASNYGDQLVKRRRQKSRVKSRSLFSKLTIGRQRKEEVLPQTAAQEMTTGL